MTGRPSRSRPSATGRVARARSHSGASINSRSVTMRAVGFGISTPTAPLPGIGATIRIDGACIVRARSSASAAIRPTFTPGAGTTSNWVTTGPVVRPAIVPSTLNVRSVSSSTCPSRSSSRLARVDVPLRGGVLQELDRRQLRLDVRLRRRHRVGLPRDGFRLLRLPRGGRVTVASSSSSAAGGRAASSRRDGARRHRGSGRLGHRARAAAAGATRWSGGSAPRAPGSRAGGRRQSRRCRRRPRPGSPAPGPSGGRQVPGPPRPAPGRRG